ncbi:helix-turn-helix DNA-binding domain protein [Arthrobacter phage Popper]|uniref:Helix-turn-helix DNA binding domain protein n=1 Tax=Arthrobacter phage Popper TaxID=2859633 RepID=A0AAE7WDC0_9CAUD|nr:helix-turn-helix DNA-binding domain protein [Arthrobacter phage Popper]QYC54979.1 helix-turn-helix DNA-binding domain protein [Arthrobacter phage Popper]
MTQHQRVDAAATALQEEIGARIDPFMRPDDLATLGVRSFDAGMARRSAMTAALAAADAVMFGPVNVARVVRATGLSIQSVNEVIRELRA